MLKHTLIVTGLLALLFGGIGTAANAQLTFTLSPDTLTGAPGDTLMFFGTLTNVGSTPLFLNSDTFNLIGLGLTLDDSPFSTNLPSMLAGGDSTGSVELFDVAIDPTTAFSAYPGSFSVVGGATNASQDTLATGNFTVNVAPAAPPSPPSTPEPGSMALLVGLGISSAGVFARSKHGRHAK